MTHVPTLLAFCCIVALAYKDPVGNSHAESSVDPFFQSDASEEDLWLEEEEGALYDSTPPGVEEEIDEDGVELSDGWLILEQEDKENEEDEEEMLQDDWTKELDSDEELDCDHPKKSSRKDGDFYFVHKTYGKKSPKKGKKSRPKWRQNCCIRGKRVGNSKRTFLSDDLLHECQERTRNLPSRTSRSCKWIFRSCCEGRALRRFYIHHKQDVQMQ